MPDSDKPTNDSLLCALLQAQQTIALQAQTIDRLTQMLAAGDDDFAPEQATSYMNSRG